MTWQTRKPVLRAQCPVSNDAPGCASGLTRAASRKIMNGLKNFPAPDWLLELLREAWDNVEQEMQQYPKHYCGVFGVYGHSNAAELSYYGLYALQHRGQESAGIVTSDAKQFHVHKGIGVVSQVFTA